MLLASAVRLSDIPGAIGDKLSASRSALSSTICARPPSRIESPRPRRRIPGNRNLATGRSCCRRVYPQPTPRPGIRALPGRVDNRDEAKAFLSSRRAKITSEQAGLNSYNRNRRAPGLRRSLVADLAGSASSTTPNSSEGVSPNAASLLPALLAATRTGLPPASDDELTNEDQPPSWSTSALLGARNSSVRLSSQITAGVLRRARMPPIRPARSTVDLTTCVGSSHVTDLVAGTPRAVKGAVPPWRDRPFGT
jgi:hypothetical protein